MAFTADQDSHRLHDAQFEIPVSTCQARFLLSRSQDWLHVVRPDVTQSADARLARLWIGRGVWGNGYLKLRMIGLLTSTRCTIVPVMSEVFRDQRCKALSYLHLQNFLPCSRTNESGLQAMYAEAVALRHVITQGWASKASKTALLKSTR